MSLVLEQLNNVDRKDSILTGLLILRDLSHVEPGALSQNTHVVLLGGAEVDLVVVSGAKFSISMNPSSLRRIAFD
jgi:hypothetical protein